MKTIFCTCVQSLICLLIVPFKSKSQSISPSGIYGASNSATAGGLTVNWVLGSLTPETMSVLPVILISFNGQLTADGHAQLTWKTAQETNNAGFEIEKSMDGKTFTKIGFVDGDGNTKGMHEYAFVDKDLTTTSYYRLKQLDLDGTYTYSRLVVVIPQEESIKHLLAYPNPSPGGKVKLRLPQKATSMQLLDNQGRIIKTWANPMDNTEIQLPLVGVFLLTVETKSESGSLKLMRP